MKKMIFAALAVASLSLAACGGSPAPDPCLSAPDVKQCEATRAASGSGNNDAMLYGVGGYLLGSMMSGGGSSRSTHTTVEKHYYSPRSVYRPSYRSSYSRSSFRSSSFGRRR